jgi:hypothetical protein
VEDVLRRLAAMGRSLAIGTVRKVTTDEEGPLVEVTLASGEPVLCRRLMLYGGDAFGLFTDESEGLEVLVALLAGDLNEAVLLGVLMTTAQAQAAEAAAGKFVLRIRDGNPFVVRATADIDAETTARIRLGAGGPADDVAVRGNALNAWLLNPVDGLSVMTAFGASGPAIRPLRAGIELSEKLEVR